VRLRSSWVPNITIDVANQFTPSKTNSSKTNSSKNKAQLLFAASRQFLAAIRAVV
jgi:hypothetical protein